MRFFFFLFRLIDLQLVFHPFPILISHSFFICLNCSSPLLPSLLFRALFCFRSVSHKSILSVMNVFRSLLLLVLYCLFLSFLALGLWGPSRSARLTYRDSNHSTVWPIEQNGPQQSVKCPNNQPGPDMRLATNRHHCG